MHRRVRCVRWMALVAAGGCLLQTTGCVSGLVPVFLSLAESATLRLILNSFLF